MWSKLQSNLLEPGVAEFKKVTDETAGWKTYNNSEANFTFKYPDAWGIISEYFYETLGGSKADRMTVTIGRNGKEEISINLRQAQCLSPCECREIGGNIIQTCSTDDPTVLEVFNRLISTFNFVE